MPLIDNILLGLNVALTGNNLFYCFVGVGLGMFVGVLPGVGALVAISLLLPITFYLEPTAAIIMLGGVYYGSSYGGSTASILLNLPGTPSSAVACIDGYPMAKQGRAGVALFATTIASFMGGSIGILIMTLFSPAIASAAVQFGAAEYFAMMALGLLAASTIGTSSPLKGIAMVVLGMLLGMVGTDVNSGLARFTFNSPELYDGIALIAIAMGLFGISEVIASVRQQERGGLPSSHVSLRSMIPTRDDVRRFWKPMLRGSAIGSFFGSLPGTGGTLASFMAYAVEKKVAKQPERFGKGAIEGVVSPESANNAADQTAFIPTMTLGIPGSVVMALILGALMIHGIAPGPNLINENPEMFWGLIMSFWVGNLMLLLLNIPLIGIWVRVLTIPYKILFPAILMFVCMGVYAVKNSVFDVQMVLLFGIVGYLVRLLGFSPAPLVLGFVLGPMMEENLRRALLLSRGDFLVFLERPISATMMVIIALLLIWTMWSSIRSRRQASSSRP